MSAGDEDGAGRDWDCDSAPVGRVCVERVERARVRFLLLVGCCQWAADH